MLKSLRHLNQDGFVIGYLFIQENHRKSISKTHNKSKFVFVHAKQQTTRAISFLSSVYCYYACFRVLFT